MGMKEKYPLRYDHSQLTGPYVIEKLYELTKGDAIITTEVGQNQMWAAQYFKYKEPRTFLSSGGLGNDGIWTWSSNRCEDGKTGQNCGKYCR